MADLVFNIAKGRVAQMYKDVDDNNPAGSVLRVFVIDANGETDDNIRDADTMAAVFALLANEVTNSGYTNKPITDTEIAFSVDDTNNRVDLDIPDQTWTGVVAGDAWTDIIVAFDPDGTDTDSQTIPLTLHDFVVTPDGSDITAQIDAAGFYRAA